MNDQQKNIKTFNLDNINNNANENNINLIIEIPFIKILPTYAIQDICHSISTKKYKKNEYVLKQGEPISNIYIVKTGSFISSINHLSATDISYNINSFIQYQNITNEPFLEERKYELDGKIKHNEEIYLFIYPRKNIFGDVEIISGKETSSFNIKANEDDSVLCYLDRNKWVNLTKRIRIPFTKATMDKMDRINERIAEILESKNNNTIDKVKIWKDKIKYQIEVNDNFEFYNKKIEKKEEKLEKQLNKYIKKEKYKKINLKEKAKSLRDLNSHKNYILKLFKYPSILKNETREFFNKYLDFGNNRKEKRLFKLYKTKSLLNINQDKNNIQSSSNNLSLLYYNNKKAKNSDYLKMKSRFFLTNSIKNNKLKNNSMVDITNLSNLSRQNNKKYNNNSIDLGYSRSRNKNLFNRNNYESKNGEEYKKIQNFSNLYIRQLINNKKNFTIFNSIDNKESKKNKKVKIQYINNKKNNFEQSYTNKSLGKTDIEKINDLLKKRCNISKNNLIERLLGKKIVNSSFNE